MPTPPNLYKKRWLTTEEVEAEYGFSKPALAKDRSTRLIGFPYVRVGRSIRYDRNDLDAFLEARKVTA